MKKDLLQGDHIERLRIHQSDMRNVVFKEEGKEILFKGEMYDVKAITRDGNFVVFYCINDKVEKRLLSGLQTNVNSQTDQGFPDKKQNDPSKNLIKDKYCQTNNVKIDDSMQMIFPYLISTPESYISPAIPPTPPEASLS